MIAPSPRRPYSAFSLIEMSIVLTIIALLMGVVLTGRTMIRASELRSIMTDASNYVSAISNFRSQYRYLPGDLPTAAAYGFGTSGDGDGLISGAERFTAWSQLNKGGFIDKTFTGTQGAGGSEDFVIGSNIPVARGASAGFSLYYANITSNGSTNFTVNLGNALTFGAHIGTNGGPPISAILTPTDAYTVDTKMDDGLPGTGKWVANGTGGGNFTATTGCASGTAATTASTYNVSLTTMECSFFIMSGY